MAVKRYWDIVDNVIRNSDILVMIGDARMPDKSINWDIVRKAENLGRKIILVFNKIDLIGKGDYFKLKREYPDAILTSAIKHLSTMRLLRMINEVARGSSAVVGIVGYPNTGKSAIINAIKGRKSAPTSPIPGYTKTMRTVRVSRRIKLIDTPGVIPFREDDETALAILSAKSAEKMKDPEAVAMEMIKRFEGMIEQFYGVEKTDDVCDTLDKIALKLNLLKKGGEPDSRTASQRIIHDWQRGKIR